MTSGPPKECIIRVMELKREYERKKAEGFVEKISADIHLERILGQIDAFVKSPQFQIGSTGFMNLKGIPLERWSYIKRYIKDMGLDCEMGSEPKPHVKFGLFDAEPRDIMVYPSLCF